MADKSCEKKYPGWTVLYNIVSDSSYIGTGWEFFDDEEKAEKCFAHQGAIGNCPTKRPFHKNDIKQMGACHIKLSPPTTPKPSEEMVEITGLEVLSQEFLTVQVHPKDLEAQLHKLGFYRLGEPALIDWAYKYVREHSSISVAGNPTTSKSKESEVKND